MSLSTFIPAYSILVPIKFHSPVVYCLCLSTASVYLQSLTCRWRFLEHVRWRHESKYIPTTMFFTNTVPSHNTVPHNSSWWRLTMNKSNGFVGILNTFPTTSFHPESFIWVCNSLSYSLRSQWTVGRKTIKTILAKNATIMLETTWNNLKQYISNR